MDADVCKTVEKFFRIDRANSVNIEDSECVKEVKVLVLDQVLFSSFKSTFEGDVLVEDLDKTVL